MRTAHERLFIIIIIIIIIIVIIIIIIIMRTAHERLFRPSTRHAIITIIRWRGLMGMPGR